MLVNIQVILLDENCILWSIYIKSADKVFLKINFKDNYLRIYRIKYQFSLNTTVELVFSNVRIPAIYGHEIMTQDPRPNRTYT